MMMNNIKTIRYAIITIFIITCLLLFAACSNSHKLSEEQIIDNICTILSDRYDVDFEVDSYEYESGWGGVPFVELPFWTNRVEFVCHPINNPSISVRGQHIQAFHPSYLYEHLEDNYVGALVAAEENQYISGLLNDDLGEVLVRVYSGGYYYDRDKDISDPIYEMIKQGTFTLKRFYAIDPTKSLSFYLYIDKSREVYFDDPEKEYEILENVGNQIVDFYQEEYGLNVFINLHVVFYEADDYKFVVSNLDNNIYSFNWPDYTDSIQLYLGEVPDSWIGIKSLEEYVEAKEAMK